MKRLFFALWPDEATRAKIDQLNNTLICNRLKKTRADNLHITLAFMGSIDETTVQAIKQQIPHITAQPITIVFDQLTSWSNASILCLTSSQQPQQIIDLVEQLKIVIEEQGVELDSRLYTAHVTLARRAQLNPTIALEPICWQAINFVLVESVSTSKGVDYQVLASWPLSL